MQNSVGRINNWNVTNSLGARQIPTKIKDSLMSLKIKGQGF
ncbi:MAG: hypothetical protein PUD34_04785 [bacterium]|nr:hypothetical protein [bacterium]